VDWLCDCLFAGRRDLGALFVLVFADTLSGHRPARLQSHRSSPVRVCGVRYDEITFALIGSVLRDGIFLSRWVL